MFSILTCVDYSIPNYLPLLFDPSAIVVFSHIVVCLLSIYISLTN